MGGCSFNTTMNHTSFGQGLQDTHTSGANQKGMDAGRDCDMRVDWIFTEPKFLLLVFLSRSIFIHQRKF